MTHSRLREPDANLVRWYATCSSRQHLWMPRIFWRRLENLPQFIKHLYRVLEAPTADWSAERNLYMRRMPRQDVERDHDGHRKE